MSSTPDQTSTGNQPRSEPITMASEVAFHTVSKWLPLAKRLKQSSSIARTNTPHQPIMPFNELPPHQLDRRNLNFGISSGTVRYGVPPTIKLPTPDNQKAAKLSILLQLRKLYPKERTQTVSFIKRNKQKIMDLTWPTEFNPGTSLQINGHSLVFIAAAPKIPETYITIRVIGLDNEIEDKMTDFAATRDHFLYPHNILDFWTTNTIQQHPDEEDPIVSWDSELFLLVDLDVIEGNYQGSSHPADIASLLPGWVAYSRSNYKLIYTSRFDHCHFCKTPDLNVCHTYKECTARLCSRCGSAGHLRRHCPVEREERTRGDNDKATEEEFRGRD
ncbi:uncharacterized protein UBRO_20247 [Ustilago bromivora]|uniref:CCHC-type domain-containing protein n=1 Tax=Ustilago bromivora TaxID=307758 RepID=A0A1K0FWW2_9BASI|nr:uncharacterized protein UBRO_20247 [Ustilago bromivora]SYW79239.1 uncharacterized protein UBRO2_02923 [Ustilago bromivora]